MGVFDFVVEPVGGWLFLWPFRLRIPRQDNEKFGFLMFDRKKKRFERFRLDSDWVQRFILFFTGNASASKPLEIEIEGGGKKIPNDRWLIGAVFLFVGPGNDGCWRVESQWSDR